MTDRITYCDVIDCCEECPRYGDDCDGDGRNPSAEGGDADMTAIPEGTGLMKLCPDNGADIIRRADAIEAVCRTRCGDKAKGCPAHSCLVIEEFESLQSAETHEIRTETHGVCLISKDDAMGAVQDHFNADGFKGYDDGQKMMDRIKALPSAEAVQGWIPCNKQMPDELEAVNVTWVNHLAPPYYKHIEDVPFVDSAVYYRGKWYWWDATVIDVLAEYGEDCNAEQIDKDIDILAWMPLPEPYKGGEEK